MSISRLLAVLIVAFGTLVLAADDAAAQFWGDPGPPEEGPHCGPGDSVTGEVCQDPAACEAIHGNPECSGAAVGVCTANEGLLEGIQTLVCAMPDPDPPDVLAGTRVVDVIIEPCTAVPPAPDFTAGNLPPARIGANPWGVGDRPGVTGLESWFWAEGERAHFWTQTGAGVIRRVTTAQDAVFDDDGELVGWGPTYVLEEVTWPCAVQAAYSARVVEWHWRLASPDREERTHVSDRPGSQPDVSGSGVEAAWQVDPEVKGAHVVSVAGVWEGDWGDRPRYTAPSTEQDYRVIEIRTMRR